MMARPHFLLFSEAETVCARRGSVGRWHFLLESTHDRQVVEASDVEPETEGERLELLAVVRGLEALDQPSRVTLVTPSRNVSCGFRFGLDEWRSNNWRWERFGRMVPVKNGDLWRRIDHALKFHTVECRTWRIDGAQLSNRAPADSAPNDRVSISRWGWAAARAARQLANWSLHVFRPKLATHSVT